MTLPSRTHSIVSCYPTGNLSSTQPVFSLIMCLVGLHSKSVLGNHPALTITARKRELNCCAPAISPVNARLNTRYFVQIRRHRKVTQQKKDRQSVCCRARADKFDARTPSGADIIVAVPYIRVPYSDSQSAYPNPNVRVTGRHYVKKKSDGQPIDQATVATPA